MECNWELFELILVVYPKAQKLHSGRIVGEGWQFDNVTLELRSLGIADFHGVKHTCNFADVFGQLAKRKLIKASFPGQVKLSYEDALHNLRTTTRDQRSTFQLLQKAEKDQKKLTAANLYVARRDEPKYTTRSVLLAEAQLWMEGVRVLGTEINPSLLVLLSGDSARVASY
jgi:hypothetical protein